MSPILKYAFVILLLSAISCHRSPIMSDAEAALYKYDKTTDTIVREKKEIRGVWLTTVNNSDWPKIKGNVRTQKKELIRMLNMCQNLNINTIILQIRPTADAFYPSELEPWSYYLTGTQGKDPGYDPLKFAIDEVHKRGMEFHAWLNPYRIGWDSIPLAKNHVAVKNPSWLVKFKRNQYFNPGIPEVRQHLNAVIKDIIIKYKVDAIHFDDYFYPHGSKVEDPFVFDDRDAFAKYGAGKDITTWRSDNVNTMVKEVYETVKSTKKEVLFGISPAGRRENSFALYADPFTWLENKWVDYLVPQIYWEFGHPVADFGRLADYWDDNAMGVSMIIGIPAYRFKNPANPAFASPDMIGRQIDYTRSKNNVQGHYYFRTESLNHPELNTYMKSRYKYKSLIPEYGNQKYAGIDIPKAQLKGKKISWSQIKDAKMYAIYVLEKQSAESRLITARCVQLTTQPTFKAEKGKSYFVTSSGIGNVESQPSEVVTLK